MTAYDPDAVYHAEQLTRDALERAHRCTDETNQLVRDSRRLIASTRTVITGVTIGARRFDADA